MADDSLSPAWQDWLRESGVAEEDWSRQIFPQLYGELHRLAQQCMRGERPDHTLQPTALLHEAWLKLSRLDPAALSSREHFLALAALIMRRILVSHARSRAAAKRGGGRTGLLIEDVAGQFEDRAIDLLALEEALERLAELDRQQARIVELRFFGGLTVEQVAQLLELSPRTVYQEWAHARAWLHGQLEGA